MNMSRIPRSCYRVIARIALAVMLVAAAPRIAPSQESAKAPLFEEDVQPILKAHCLKCHNTRDPEGGLDLSSAAALLKGSDDGPVVIKGSVEKSILLQKITAGKMPPPEAKNPLSAEKVAVIRNWIEGGALGKDEPVVAPVAKEREVTDKDREFWAFRSPVAAPMPVVKTRGRVRTPVDAFLLARLEAKGLDFSPDATKLTLLRRAHLDLVGLPPSPDEIEQFLADDCLNAYERLIDRLLDSPRYGERWGRHWLDVAGYTDSPHYTADKAGNMVAFDDWRYRDYVVRSFNQDKPYDRFLVEQLAGDELVNWRAAAEYTPEIFDALIATGYLRTTPDWTHGPEFPNYRFDTISRVVDHVSTGLFGLTLGCARCHSHKFDPIPHEDYYRLAAVFAPAYNTDHWLPPVDRYLADVPPPVLAEIERHNAQVDERVKQLEAKLEDLQRPIQQRLFTEKLASVSEPLREDVKAAFETPAEKRNEIQRYLVKKFEASLKPSAAEVRKGLSAEDQAACTAHDQEIANLRKSKRSFGRLQGLSDVGKPPAVHLLYRGDPGTPGKVVEAGFPAVLCAPGQTAAVRPPDLQGDSSGRRLALARWLTSKDHPLTARVMVNRIWQHHFGKGLVVTPENFGHSGSPPTHPELLDWLAVDFREQGWRIKRLHKLIMTSTAYRQSAHRPAAAPAADPDNDLLWRMNLRRLEAESLRDSVLAVSGQLDRTIGGPPVPVQSNPDGLVLVPDKGPTPTSQWRRTLYLKTLRGSHASGQGFKLSMLEIFDFPEMAINCTRRSTSATPLQSLALVNSKFMLEQARFFADRVSRDDAAAGKRVAAAFVLALARPPNPDEQKLCEEFLASQANVYLAEKLTADQAAARALADLCLMLLASNEFLYIG